MKSKACTYLVGFVVSLSLQTGAMSADIEIEAAGSSIAADSVLLHNSTVEGIVVNNTTVDGGHVVSHDASCATCGTECGAAGCGACAHGISKEELKHRLGEQIHRHRLKGVTSRAAQYTHWWNLYHARMTPWHRGYYHRDWGSPIALVVPPTSAYQTKWGWGVGNTTVTPLYHQFRRSYPGVSVGAGQLPFRATPHWPSHTDQFGVYYVRGPW